jgi:hypothetical protein
MDPDLLRRKKNLNFATQDFVVMEKTEFKQVTE